jgi:two-component system, chemotaxis family, sensor kinase CheA
MDSNQKRFVEDALDLLNELDEGLLQLESNPQATAPLEQVFRTMHTIKGGANMFGFENIGELAHHLETLYDLVRQRKMQVTDGLISITLHAFDKVRDLLKETDASTITNAQSLKDHLAVVLEFMKSEAANAGSNVSLPSSILQSSASTFFLRIKPTVKITADGNHPLIFILQDLESLGTSKTFLYRQSNDEILHWDLFLVTTSTLNELESYFLFVENDCTIDSRRLLSCNGFENPDFLAFISPATDRPVSLDELFTLADKISAELSAIDTEEETSKGRRFNDTYIKVSKRKIDDLLNWISELIIIQSQLVNATSGINSTAITEVTEQLELITSRLRDTSLEIGLVPIETLVTKFKRLVRDLSKTLNKKVNFISEGAETEMDKDVIELMTEPMIHIIRNCIDHGLESAEERKAAGKSDHGTVKLKAFNSSSYVHIIITDDGKGINKDKVRIKAIENGIIDANATLTNEELHCLIFHPGLSTASEISSVSGRGVGMDVVHQKIKDLRGYVTVSSKPGEGTSVHIKLPLSRSIIEGMLVKVDSSRYIVPLNVIDRIDRIRYEDLQTQNRLNKTVLVNEEPLSVLSLRQQFHSGTPYPKYTDIISVTINGTRKGISVDRIEGKMQTVMKPLGEAYNDQDFIAGSSILGDGGLALVIDPVRLFQLFQS